MQVQTHTHTQHARTRALTRSRTKTRMEGRRDACVHTQNQALFLELIRCFVCAEASVRISQGAARGWHPHVPPGDGPDHGRDARNLPGLGCDHGRDGWRIARSDSVGVGSSRPASRPRRAIPDQPVRSTPSQRIVRKKTVHRHNPDLGFAGTVRRCWVYSALDPRAANTFTESIAAIK